MIQIIQLVCLDCSKVMEFKIIEVTPEVVNEAQLSFHPRADIRSIPSSEPNMNIQTEHPGFRPSLPLLANYRPPTRQPVPMPVPVPSVPMTVQMPVPMTAPMPMAMPQLQPQGPQVAVRQVIEYIDISNN